MIQPHCQNPYAGCRPARRVVSLLAAVLTGGSLSLGAIVGGTLGLAGPALAQADASTPVEVRRRQALSLAREGRCDSALPLLRGLPADTEGPVLLALAVCENVVGTPSAALDAIGLARARGSTDAELDLQEGIAHFQIGDAVRAEAALERAAAGGASRPDTLLYRGLTALLLEQPEAAVTALEAARRLDPNHVEPVASYYTGLARRSLGDEAAARKALERVRDEWPGTAWAEEAERVLGRADDAGGPWIAAEFGLEYDDNAVLRGADVVLPEEIPGQQDLRATWQLQTGSEFWSAEGWSVGGLFQIDGSIHDDLPQFDVTQPTVALWIDRALSSATLARLELSTSYAWLESDPFQLAHAATALLHHSWDERQATTLRVGFRRTDNRFSDDDVPDGPGRVGAPCLRASDSVCSPPGIDESRVRNRDGNGSWIGIRHHVELRGPLHDVGIWGGYRFRRFSARGAEFSFQEHEIELGAVTLLPAGFDLTASGHYAWRDYRHPTSFPDPSAVFAGVQYGLSRSDRRERELRTQLVLGRNLTDYLRLEGRWHHERIRSTADLFDYRRDIFGGYLVLAFGSLDVGPR